MNIAVIGANGRSGRVFVEKALATRHTIRAGVHTRHNLESHVNLTIMPCDATQQADLKRLIAGQDAVVSFLGHTKGSAAHVQTQAITAAIAVMHETGVRRLVSLTGTGVRFAGDRIPLVDHVLNTAIRIIDPARVQDGIDHVTVLKDSGLDWTVIRVLKLQNIRPRPFQLREHGPTQWYTSRDEVAQAVLQVLEGCSFVGLAPIISKA